MTSHAYKRSRKRLITQVSEVSGEARAGLSRNLRCAETTRGVSSLGLYCGWGKALVGGFPPFEGKGLTCFGCPSDTTRGRILVSESACPNERRKGREALLRMEKSTAAQRAKQIRTIRVL